MMTIRLANRHFDSASKSITKETQLAMVYSLFLSCKAGYREKEFDRIVLFYGLEPAMTYKATLDLLVEQNLVSVNKAGAYSLPRDVTRETAEKNLLSLSI